MHEIEYIEFLILDTNNDDVSNMVKRFARDDDTIVAVKESFFEKRVYYFY